MNHLIFILVKPFGDPIRIQMFHQRIKETTQNNVSLTVTLPSRVQVDPSHGSTPPQHYRTSSVRHTCNHPLVGSMMKDTDATLVTFPIATRASWSVCDWSSNHQCLISHQWSFLLHLDTKSESAAPVQYFCACHRGWWDVNCLIVPCNLPVRKHLHLSCFSTHLFKFSILPIAESHISLLLVEAEAPFIANKSGLNISWG